MIPFTSTSIKSGDDRRAELRAVGCAILSSLIFLFTFVSLYKPVRTDHPSAIKAGPAPTPAAPLRVAQTAEPPDPNDKYRIIPETFSGIDFANWRYGRYRFWGNNLALTLTQGKHVYPYEESGGGETFSLSDVLYTDVTGDAKPEAIVILSHVQCGGSCDGGSALLYVYQHGNHGLRKIWEYETGSMAYGCGLKSLTLTKKQIALEMFGQCWQAASSFSGSGKFLVRDLTRSVFHFNGRRFVKRVTKVTAAPAADLRRYTPQIQIIE